MKKPPQRFERIYQDLMNDLKRQLASKRSEESYYLTLITDTELSDGPFVSYSIDDLLSYVAERGNYKKHSLIATRNTQDDGYWIFIIRYGLLDQYETELRKEKLYDRLHLLTTVLPVLTMFVYVLNKQFNWMSSTVVSISLLSVLVLQLIGLYYTTKRFKVFDPRVRLTLYLVKKHIF